MEIFLWGNMVIISNCLRWPIDAHRITRGSIIVNFLGNPSRLEGSLSDLMYAITLPPPFHGFYRYSKLKLHGSEESLSVNRMRRGSNWRPSAQKVAH